MLGLPQCLCNSFSTNRMPVAERPTVMAEWKEGSSNSAPGEDGKAPASFLAVIANAAVAIDGLKRVRVQSYAAAHGVHSVRVEQSTGCSAFACSVCF